MNVMIPVRPDGSVEPRFGKAPMVAVAQVDNDGHVTDWHTFKVEWDRLHNAVSYTHLTLPTNREV